MLEIEIELNRNLANSLLDRLTGAFPDVEIGTAETGLRFCIEFDETVDRELKKLETVLGKFEKARMAEDQVPIAIRNLGEPDQEAPYVSIAGFIFTGSAEDPGDSVGNTIITFAPGHAFGTGSHPSTGLALTALKEFYTPGPGHPDRLGSSVLDAGTGSGILALAAARLGTGPVLAVDSSSVAVDAARANSAGNNLTPQIEVALKPVKDVDGRFDLILANLTHSVLLKSAANLVNLLNPGGTLIAAGFTDTQTPGVHKSMSKAGAMMIKSYSLSGWTALSFKKPA